MSLLSGRYLSRGNAQVTIFGPVDGFFYYSRNGNTGEVPIALDLRALETAVSAMSGAIEQWITTSSDWEDRGEDERLPALEALRDTGARAFEIIEGADPGTLRAILEEVTFLEVRVRRPHVPWEFLYLGDPTASVDVTKFLGYRLVVGRPGPQQVIPNNPNAPAVVPFAVPKQDLLVAIAEDERLGSALSGEERRIFTDRKIAIDVLPTMLGPKCWSKIEAFVEQSPFLTHFNCHATPEDPAKEEEGALEVTETYKISRSSIGRLPICEGSLVVLNCCYGHTLRHDVQATMATEFYKHELAAVVAATERIVDEYGTLWAKRFYDALLNGKSLGAAMLDARRQVIDETSNPACLVYGFIGIYSTKLTSNLAPLVP